MEFFVRFEVVFARLAASSLVVRTRETLLVDAAFSLISISSFTPAFLALAGYSRSASLNSEGKVGREFKFLAKGRLESAAIFMRVGSVVTTTMALSCIFAVRAISLRLIELRRTFNFFGGTSAIIFCLEALIWLIISVISSSGSM